MQLGEDRHLRAQRAFNRFKRDRRGHQHEGIDRPVPAIRRDAPICDRDGTVGEALSHLASKGSHAPLCQFLTDWIR